MRPTHAPSEREMPRPPMNPKSHTKFFDSIKPRSKFGPKPRAHCRRGHPYDAANTQFASIGARAGRRTCKACKQASEKRHYYKDPAHTAFKNRMHKARRKLTAAPDFRKVSPEHSLTYFCANIDGATFRDGERRSLHEFIPSNYPSPLEELMHKEEQEEEQLYKRSLRRIHGQEWRPDRFQAFPAHHTARAGLRTNTVLADAGCGAPTETKNRLGTP